MKYYIFFLLSLSICTVGCKKGSKPQVVNLIDGLQDSSLRIHVDSSYSYDQFKEAIVQLYVDSLNSFKSGTKLPSFLMDTDLDVNSEINNWPNSSFVSLREEIFHRVYNIDVLMTIIQTPHFKHQFDGIENRRKKIPSDEVSTYMLAQERIHELSK